MGAGKILQMVGGRERQWEKRGVSVRAGGKRIEGARESKNRGPRDLDRNIMPLLERHFHVTNRW